MSCTRWYQLYKRRLLAMWLSHDLKAGGFVPVSVCQLLVLEGLDEHEPQGNFLQLCVHSWNGNWKAMVPAIQRSLWSQQSFVSNSQNCCLFYLKRKCFQGKVCEKGRTRQWPGSSFALYHIVARRHMTANNSTQSSMHCRRAILTEKKPAPVSFLLVFLSRAA